MANARAAYYAARLSLETLIGTSAWVYIWTLTFPDAKSPVDALKHWAKLIKKWEKLECFRVIEKHPGGHGYHIHFVTTDRLSVHDVRKRTDRHGFGRINVIRVPASKAFYVIKYLMKQARLKTGRRMWACVGFKGVRSSDVMIRDTFWQEVYSGICPNGYNLAARRQIGIQRIVSRCFKRDATEEKQKMKSEQQPLVIKSLDAGNLVLVGEYRTTKVDSFELDVKGQPGRKSKRFVLRHAIEAGPNACFVVEWTPDGTKEEEIKVPFKKGQIVLCNVRTASVEKGVSSYSGELVALP